MSFLQSSKSLPFVLASILPFFVNSICGSFSASTAFAGGEDEKVVGASTETSQNIEVLLRDLNSDSYASRQSAFLSLWGAGEEANAPIEAAISGNDPELAKSAKWLQLVRKLGSPQTGPENLSNLGLLQTGDFYTLIRLANENRWGSIIGLLEVLSPEQRLQLQEDYSDRERLIAMAFQSKQKETIAALVDNLYPPIEAKAARKLWSLNGIEVEENHPFDFPIEARIYEREWNGDVDGAIRQAEENGMTLIANFIRLRHQRWKELTSLRPKPPATNELRDYKQVRAVAMQARYFEWNNDEENFATWRKAAADAMQNRYEPNERSFVLTSMGLIDEGLAISTPVNKLLSMHCYFLCGRYNEAWKVLGIDDIHQLDIDQLIESQSRIDGNYEYSQEYSCLALLSNHLHRMGMRAESEKIEKHLIQLAEKDNSGTLWAEFAKQLQDSSRRDRCLEVFAEILDKQATGKRGQNDLANYQEGIFDLLFPDFAGESPRFLKALASVDPKRKQSEHVASIEALNQATLPEGWNAEKFREFAQKVIRDDDDGDSSTATIAKLAKDLGFHQLAISYLLSSPYAASRQLLCETLAESGNIRQALVGLESMSRNYSNSFTLTLLQAKWLDEIGRSDEAKALRDLAFSIPRTSENLKYQVDLLKTQGFEKEMKQILKFACDTIEPTSEINDSIYESGWRNLEDIEPKLALDYIRIQEAKGIQPTTKLRSNNYRQIILLSNEYALQARVFAEEGNFELADRWVRKAHSIRPDDIDVAIKIFPVAAAKNEMGFAKAWYNLYKGYQLSHLEEWPQDAMYHNNLAWLQAKVNLDLDEAIEHSKKACEIKPNDATYIDTLAEVEFRRGNYDRAIELALLCCRLDGKDRHHRDQLQRFLDAKSHTE